MSVQDVLEMANELSREDKTLLYTSLGEQLAGDFSLEEVEDIKRAVAEADAEFEQGECLTTGNWPKNPACDLPDFSRHPDRKRSSAGALRSHFGLGE